MIDSDLAKLYGVQTFNLNKAVKRNIQRFPADFMFQLTKDEYESLIFQNGISKAGRGGRRFMQHCKDNQLDNQELMKAIDLLMDRTKPRKIGF